MAIIIFLFQGLNVARGKTKHYNTNAIMQRIRKTLADGSGTLDTSLDDIQLRNRDQVVHICQLDPLKDDSLQCVLGE